MEKPKQQAYVKLETGDAISSKKDVLSIEMNLLQIISKIGAYKKLRKQEIRDRIELKKRLRDIKSEIAGLMGIFPEVEKPKIKFKRKSSGGREVNKLQKNVKEETLKKSIEEQLLEIKTRLQKLDQR